MPKLPKIAEIDGPLQIVFNLDSLAIPAILAIFNRR